MIVRIHGSRGSHPVSTTSSRIEEIQESLWNLIQDNKFSSWKECKAFLNTQPRHVHQTFGGATTCIEIDSSLASMPIFIDAGTGFSNACFDPKSALATRDFIDGKSQCALFFTHTHWDHISGLITAPQLFTENNQFHFYGLHKDLRGRIAGLFDERYFPVPFSFIESRTHFHQIPLHEKVTLGSVQIDHFPQSHPGGSFAYRFSDGKNVFVMATDTDLRNTHNSSFIPGNNLYSNADLLLVDAHFSPEDFVTREDYGHAHLEQAIDFGVAENAKILYLFHQNPFYSDQAIQHQLDRAWDYIKKNHTSSKTEIRVAFDGDVIELKNS